jgi:DNA repair exonuclease SbcCD ATPase subunit
MLDNDEQSGVFTFMVGIIVLVLAGVGLSLLVDRRFSFSQGKAALETVIKANEEDLADLTARKDDLQADLERHVPRRTGNAAELAQLTTASADLGKRLDEARMQVGSLENEIPKLEEGFSHYRDQYRQSEWTRAVGESLGSLTIRGGREYRHAVIARVTDVGLEIRHEEGIARLQAPDLSAELRDRFQWDDARRTRALQEEIRHHDEVTKTADPGEVTIGKPSRAGAVVRETPDQENLAKLRADVVRLKTRVVSLKSEHSTARSQASSGAPSVPGSLETWSARATRLGSDLAKARAALALARERLATVSPGDSLLRAEPEQE